MIVHEVLLSKKTNENDQTVAMKKKIHNNIKYKINGLF